MPETNQTRMEQNNSSSFWNSGVYYLILILIVLLLLGGAFFLLYPRIYPKLNVSDQKVGESILVKEARLANPGWVVVKTVNEVNKPGRIVGESPYLTSGRYESFHIEFEPLEVQIDKGVLDESKKDMRFSPGDELYVQILEDVGNDFETGINEDQEKPAELFFAGKVEKKITFE